MRLILLFIPVLFLAACSDNEHPALETNPVEISLSTGFASTSASGVETRGGGSVYSNKLLSGGILPLSVVRIDQAGETDASYPAYTQNNIHGAGQAPRNGRLSLTSDPNPRMTFEAKEVYLSRPKNNNTKLIAWYPAVGTGGSTWTVSGAPTPIATVGFTVDGETDILISNLVEGNPFNPYNGATNSMTFRHLLTRFVIRAYTLSAGVQAITNGIRSIAIAGKGQTCSVRLPGVDAATNTHPSEISFTGSSDLPIIYKYPEDNSPIAGYANPTGLPLPVANPSAGEPTDPSVPDPCMAGYAIVAPGSGPISLLISTGIQETPTSVSLPAPAAGFLAGHSYTFTLEFTSMGIMIANVSIINWETGETVVEEVYVSE